MPPTSLWAGILNQNNIQQSTELVPPIQLCPRSCYQRAHLAWGPEQCPLLRSPAQNSTAQASSPWREINLKDLSLFWLGQIFMFLLEMCLFSGAKGWHAPDKVLVRWHCRGSKALFVRSVSSEVLSLLNMRCHIRCHACITTCAVQCVAQAALPDADQEKMPSWSQKCARFAALLHTLLSKRTRHWKKALASQCTK